MLRDPQVQIAIVRSLEAEPRLLTARKSADQVVAAGNQPGSGIGTLRVVGVAGTRR
jgi:hypothetical protein